MEKGGDEMKPGIKQAVTGALAGAANGFSVPAGDCFWCRFLPAGSIWIRRRLFATSVAVILPLSAISLAVYFWKGGLDLGGALPYLLGGLAGDCFPASCSIRCRLRCCGAFWAY